MEDGGDEDKYTRGNWSLRSGGVEIKSRGQGLEREETVTKEEGPPDLGVDRLGRVC